MLRFLLMSTLFATATLAASLGGSSQDSTMSILQDYLSSVDQQRPKPVQDNSGSAIAGSAVKYNIINEYLGGGDGYDRPKAPLPTVMPSTGGSASAALNCRDFILSIADTVAKCSNVKQGDLNLGAVSTSGSYCRWDPTANSCWCPRPKSLCSEMKQCYWNSDLTLTGNPFAFSGQYRPDSGECISNAERFYNILSNLLTNRGKKDFAIRINYSSAPARGQLPSGPYGPAIIGGGRFNQGMMPGYAGPQLPGLSLQAQGYGLPSAYGLPALPNYGMPPQGYGMPPQMPSYGAPPISGYGYGM